MPSASTHASAGSRSVRTPAARATSQPLVGNEPSRPDAEQERGRGRRQLVLVDGREVDVQHVRRDDAGAEADEHARRS